MRHLIVSTLILFICLQNSQLMASEVIPAPKPDSHYTKVGFFDIHVCNWPDKDLFLMALLSTYDYKNINKIEVYTSENLKLGNIATAKYRIILQKGKPEKRVFITQFAIPKTAGDGWYRSVISMNDGSKYEAKDYVTLKKMDSPIGMNPKADATLKEPPVKLTWKAVPGAKNYQVFIKDAWEQRTIHSSRILNKTELRLPDGLLKKGGIYNWIVHARDVNEDVLLGDFNHGSLNSPIEFTIE